MTRGRPYKSTTPLWHNTAAIKVRIYRWMERERATKSACAREMEMSRTTVIKWWDVMRWTEEKRKAFKKVRQWYIEHDECFDPKLCAATLKLSIEDVYLDVATWRIMVPKYVV